MDNPHEYDDQQFVTVSNRFQSEAEDLFTDLWEAGARLSDIESEIANALDNALEGNFAVKITPQ